MTYLLGKATQSNKIAIKAKPEHLILLAISKDGSHSEILGQVLLFGKMLVKGKKWSMLYWSFKAKGINEKYT